MKRRLVLLLWSCLLSVPLTAQARDGLQNITYITSDDGLSQGEVTCFLQDRQGFLWIGTRGGLNRYNGYTFDLFEEDLHNPNSLLNNSIEALYEDSQGNIWIGTKSDGLSCYDPVQHRFRHFQAREGDTTSISGNRIIAIAEGDDGLLWFGTWQNGLSIYDPASGTFRKRLPRQQVNAILPGSAGEMWVATQSGLLLFDHEGTLCRRYIHPGGRPQYVELLADRNSDKIWIGTWQEGLLLFDPRTESFQQFKHTNSRAPGMSANNTYALFQDDCQQIWVGTWGGGLMIFDPQTEKFTRRELAVGRYRDAQSLYRDLLTIFQDREGTIWIGTNGGGICKVVERTNPFGLLRGGEAAAPRMLPTTNPIWSVLKDSYGTLWLGSKGNGFLSSTRDMQSFTRFHLTDPDAELNSNKVFGGKVMLAAQDSSLWVGTHHGLYQLRRRAGGSYHIERRIVPDTHRPGSIQGNKISALAQTSDGTLWVGTQQTGLHRLLDAGRPGQERFLHYPASDLDGALKNERVSALLQDRSGRLWVGTYGGLHLYRPEQDDFVAFTKKAGDPHSLSSNIILSLFEDRQGQLWIGTPNGLNQALPAQEHNLWSFRAFQDKDGLPNDYIHAILDDAAGNLWISTNKGIIKFDPQREVSYHYDVNDGLQGNAFSEGAAYQDQNGILYFGGLYGLTYFDPDSIFTQPFSPPVFLTGFRIFNRLVNVNEPFDGRIILDRSLTYTDKVVLTHQQNVFSLEYTALDYRAPHKNVYRYRLRGLEKEWNEVGSQRQVTYTNLRPGTYTFEVSAANNHLLWNDHPARLQIEVLPPFWATAPAYLLYGLVLTGLLWLYHTVTQKQNRLRNKLKLEQLERHKEAEVAELKTRFFTNITHELRTPLTLITGPVEALMDTAQVEGKARDYLLTIHYHTQRLLGLVNQLLDFRKAESGNMTLQTAPGNFAAFAHEVFLSFQPLAQEQQTTFLYTSEPKEQPLFFDRDKLEIVLCNLLSNAFKFSPPGSCIELSVRQTERPDGSLAQRFPQGYCEISVRDNGTGMPAHLVDKIFNSFYQIANTHSVKLIGTGIGLSLVERIVRLHRGTVVVHSEPGQGSEFLVRLPLGRNHLTEEQILSGSQAPEDSSPYAGRLSPIPAPLPATPPLPADAPAATLLVVEDNANIRTFIRQLFAGHYHIIEANDGWQGWELARSQAPDLIISDVMMPELDGIALCGKIKTTRATCHIPVVLLTARTANVFQVEGYDSGADAYVTKPFKPEVLKAQVAGILAARRHLKEYFSRKITLQPADIEITSQDEAFLQQAVAVVEDNLTNESLGKDFLAQALALSPSSLYRKIKSTTDLSINAFIRSIRLRRAAQLLRSSDYNVSEIGYQVGFSDLKYFRKCFREQFGHNPSDYTAAVPEENLPVTPL